MALSAPDLLVSVVSSLLAADACGLGRLGVGDARARLRLSAESRPQPFAPRLVVTFTALRLLLLVLKRSHPNAPTFEWWLGNSTIVVDATVGAIVASRRPENPVGWLLCLAGVTVSMSSFASQYAIYALLARPGSLPGGEALA